MDSIDLLMLLLPLPPPPLLLWMLLLFLLLFLLLLLLTTNTITRSGLCGSETSCGPGLESIWVVQPSSL